MKSTLHSPLIDAPQTRAGLREVADLAKVSPATVARAFAGNAPVAAKTRHRILAAAAQLNYKPNLLARSLRSGKTRSIGILWELGGPQQTVHMTRSLTIRIQQRGYLGSIMDTACDDTTVMNAISDFSRRQVDGLIVQWGPPAPLQTDSLLALLKDCGAVVLVTHALQNLPADEIVQDRFTAIRDVARHFVRTGRRRPAIILPVPAGNEKVRVYQDELARGGIDPAAARIIPTSWVSNAKVHYSQLQTQFPAGCDVLQQMDCLLCGSDEAAIAAIAWARARGLRVPQDLAIVGFNDSDGALFHNPPLASIDRQDEAIAGLVEEMLFSRLDNPDLPFRRKDVPMRFVCRESAG